MRLHYFFIVKKQFKFLLFYSYFVSIVYNLRKICFIEYKIY